MFTTTYVIGELNARLTGILAPRPRTTLRYFNSSSLLTLIMLSRQALLRAKQCTSQRAPTILLRHTLQRRSASGGGPPLTGAADNAFNRERAAVKAHAAKSAGMDATLFLLYKL